MHYSEPGETGMGSERNASRHLASPELAVRGYSLLVVLRLREDGCVCPGGGGIRKTGQKEAQMRILAKSVRVVRSGVWVALAACALVVGWQAARGLQAAEESHGVVVGNMDAAVKAGNDFFRYCNGAWLAKTEIPADRPSISVFATLVDKSSQRVRGLIDEAVAANGPAGTNTRKVADLYKSFMDEAGIEAEGMAPLAPHLQEIAGVKDKKALAVALGKTLRADVDALNNTNFHTANLFGLWVAPGFNDSEHYAAYLMQGGLQLPDREYYTGQSERMKNLRTAYAAHVAAMLKLAGFPDTEARAA